MVFIHRKYFGFVYQALRASAIKFNFEIYDFIFLSKNEKRNQLCAFSLLVGHPLLCREVSYGVTKTIKIKITKGYISPHCFSFVLNQPKKNPNF